MVRLASQVLFLSSLTYAVADICPILGPVFPLPSNLQSSDALKDALQNLTSALDNGFKTGNSSHGPVDSSATYSVQVFSTEDKLFEYYHRGSSLSNTTGVQHPGGDTVYRIGSISKLFTVYMFLTSLGDGYWNDPVTKYVPELRNKSTSPVTSFVQWDQITLGALAGQVSGVTRDLYYADAISPTLVQEGAFPPLEPSDMPPCIINTTQCSRQQFFKALDTRQPVYLPNTTPIYSNTNFVILAYALESISGKSYKDILKNGIIQPLGLNRTSYSAPNVLEGAIVGNVSASGWNIDMADATPMGGIYSSANDLASLGQSILNYTLLPSNSTRAWMKPTSYTSSLLGGVGRPWEIYRAQLSASNNRIVDIYTKGGDIGAYHTLLALLPDYNVGFVVMVAGSQSPAWIAGIISDVVIPALEESARSEATDAFAGSYKASNGLNSSLTFHSTPGKPGLGIKEWVSNGTDLINLLASAFDTDTIEDNVRVYPTNVESTTSNGTKVEWRIVTQASTTFQNYGPFSACGTWFSVDGAAWGNHGIDQLEFTLGDDGKAKSVSPLAFKIVLDRA